MRKDIPLVKSKTIKATVKNNYNHPMLAEVLPVGYQLEIFVMVTGEDEIVPAVTGWDRAKRENVEIYPAVTIPKGRFKCFHFTGANGGIYSEDIIYRIVGPKSMGDIFEKHEIIIHDPFASETAGH